MKKKYTQKHRLDCSKAYKKVFEEVEIKLYKENFLFLARRKENCIPRLGVVISKKRVRLAVNRNYIKRVVKESFRITQEKLKGLEVIFLARSGLDTIPRNVLKNSLKDQWNRLIKVREKKMILLSNSKER